MCLCVVALVIWFVIAIPLVGAQLLVLEMTPLPEEIPWGSLPEWSRGTISKWLTGGIAVAVALFGAQRFLRWNSRRHCPACKERLRDSRLMERIDHWMVVGVAAFWLLFAAVEVVHRVSHGHW
jgi:hypothetical protein